MGRQRTPATFPLDSDEWQHVISTLRLAPQQAKIVELILRGKRNKQIAHILGISESTVRTYLGRMFARLDVSDRMELVLRVFAVCRSNSEGSKKKCRRTR
jgi:DNA-binding CsgD family transcriptional regulator